MSPEINLTIDGSEAERELEQLEQHAKFTAQTVVATTRKGYQSLVLLGDIMGYAIPMWFNLMAQAALMAGETFAELAAAETMTGWLAVKSALTFSIALMMFYRAAQLQQQKTEVENKLNSILQLGNLWF